MISWEFFNGFEIVFTMQRITHLPWPCHIMIIWHGFSSQHTSCSLQPAFNWCAAIYRCLRRCGKTIKVHRYIIRTTTFLFLDRYIKSLLDDCWSLISGNGIKVLAQTVLCQGIFGHAGGHPSLEPAPSHVGLLWIRPGWFFFGRASSQLFMDKLTQNYFRINLTLVIDHIILTCWEKA